MENISKRHILSLLIAAGGCIAGAYSAFAAYSNGETLTGGTAGAMFGLAFAAVVIISWIMLPWADRRAGEGSYRDAWLWRASWLMALGFVLANSIASHEGRVGQGFVQESGGLLNPSLAASQSKV